VNESEESNEPEPDAPDETETQPDACEEEQECVDADETDHTDIVITSQHPRKQMTPRMLKQILFKNLSLRRRK